MDKINIFFIGTAGSGKTHLVSAFSEWLDINSINYVILNLDPGSENTPYSPDVDIRDYFTLEDIIVNYGVGPNGAQIIGSDLIGVKIEDIKEEIDYYDAPYVLIDTPGQMELFTLRQSGNIVVDAFGKNSVVVFLFDPVISKTPNGFVSITFLFASSIFRLRIPHIPVLSKCDILQDFEVEKIISWNDPDKLYFELGHGIEREFFHVIKDSGFLQSPIPTSSKTGFGMEDVYDKIQEIFFGGEDMKRILY